MSQTKPLNSTYHATPDPGLTVEMSGVDDSGVVSSDEEAGYISTPKQPTDCTQYDLVLKESETSNPVQGGASEHSMIVPSVQNGKQGLEQKLLNTHKDTSENGEEIHQLHSLLEEKLQKQETLEKQNENLKKENKRLMEENQQLKTALAGCGVEQSKKEQFCSTARAHQLPCMQGDVPNSVNPRSFQGFSEDPPGDTGSIEGDLDVSQEASCDSKYICNVQLTDHLNQTQAQNKHQVFVKSTTDSSVMCKCIAPHCKSRSDLNGDGVLIAILGPPCKTDGVPEKSIILKRTVPTNVQADACESMLLQIAYPRAPGPKYCLLQTTFDNSSMLVNPGVTAEAISFLVANWPQWKKDYYLHTLIVIIPYGGKYKVDEEKAVNEAIRSGIIIVAASGWGGLGIAFPAKLGAVISVGAVQCNGTLAPFSPKGRELDCVSHGLFKVGRDFIFGTGISTIEIATDLALLFQHFSCTQGQLLPHIGTFVVRELFEIVAGNNPATIDAVVAIIDLSKDQAFRYIKEILEDRNRRDVVLYPQEKEAVSNTEHWSSKRINEHYKENDNDFPHLSGRNITIAIIDDLNDEVLDHLRSVHGIEVETAEKGVKYFSIRGPRLSYGCCINHINKSHALQCAKIIGNTAPDSEILIILQNNLEEFKLELFEIALNIVNKKTADILLLSSIVLDTVDLKYIYNISAHLTCRILLCAAGNEGKRDRTSTLCYPPRTGNVIVIGACDQHGKRCSYSSCGRQVDFLCPGEFSCAVGAGTCCSASAAAALIALLLEYIDMELHTAQEVEVWVSMKEEWKPQALSKLARNTHLMRALLSSSKLRLCSGTKHAIDEGFGMMLIDNLVLLTPGGIRQVIADFHTDRHV